MIEIGSTFGLLTVIAHFHCRSQGRGRRRRWYLCRCACGLPFKAVRGDLLVTGNTTSCGCVRLAAATRHGYSNTPTYKTWAAMRRRCNDPRHPRYDDYGGRGIRVCDRWNDVQTGFDAFVEDMGWRPKGLTLDRGDVDGMYEKSNCKWATIVEQRWNRRDMRPQLFDELRAEQAYWDEQERLRAADANVV